MGTPELSVVCRSCGSEVSPYVTECPYCGTRLRKRAPRLEQREGELRARESRRQKRRRKAEERRRRRAERRSERSEGAERSVLARRPWVTIAAIALPAAYLVVSRALGLGLSQAGAVVGPVGGEWWRYLSAGFVYDGVGYLAVCGLALALLLPALEERLGAIATALLVLGSAALGMVAVEGLAELTGATSYVAAGGNGVALAALAAVYVLRRDEEQTPWGGGIDRIAFAVGAAVLLALALVEDSANVVVALAAGLIGLAAGHTARRSGR